MRYLVVLPKGTLCELLFAREGDRFDLPYECWAIRTGKQALFVNTRMAQLLKTWYVHGTFETRAVYALSAEEMALMLSDPLGPTDHDRYTATLASTETVRRHRRVDGWWTALQWAVHGGQLAVFMIWLSAKWFGRMLFVLFILSWMGPRR
jgi:hypothetical protein